MSAASTGGTYTLVIHLAEAAHPDIGALGTHRLAPGWYAYTGSAGGPGGLARVDRHAGVAAGERGTRHWHVDYLLGLPAASLDAAVATPARDVECAVAGALPGTPVPGFGSSDCDCPSHLARADTRSALFAAVTNAHRGATD